MQGICVDASASNVLQKGERYYLFSSSAGYVYASRFPRKQSHFGCFQQSRFEIMEQPVVERTRNTILQEGLIYSARYTGQLKHFLSVAVIYIGSTHGPYYHENNCYVYADFAKTKLLGRGTIRDFEKVEAVHAPVVCTEERTLDVKVSILPPDPEEEFEQLTLF